MKKKNNSYINSIFIKLYSFLQKKSLGKLKEIMYYIDRFLMLFVKTNKNSDNKKTVAIVFNLALGDGIVFKSSINKINELFNEEIYSITLFCQKGLKNIFSDIDGNINIIEVDFNKSTINLFERIKTLKLICNKKYNILFDPVGANECFTNVLMSRCIKADKKIGCIIKNKKVICSKNILKNTYTEIKYLKEKTLIGQYFEFFYDKYNITYCGIDGVMPQICLPKKYYIIFPSASTDLKKWPIERYAEIVKRIYNKTGLKLLICGTSVDKEETDKLISLMSDIPYVDIIGKTSLLEFIYVINHAEFVITNDTSTYHIAVVNQVPVSIITGGYTYDRYVKYDFITTEDYKKPYDIVKKMKCFNCNNNCSKIKNIDKIWPCLDLIDIEYAWKIINKMIDENYNIGVENETKRISKKHKK